MKIIKKFHGWRINKQQEKVNQLVEKEGFTDKVIEKQASINKKGQNMESLMNQKSSMINMFNKCG